MIIVVSVCNKHSGSSDHSGHSLCKVFTPSYDHMELTLLCVHSVYNMHCVCVVCAICILTMLCLERQVIIMVMVCNVQSLHGGQ